MPRTSSPWPLLRARLADLRALQGAITLLAWDQETYLPPRGAAARGEQLATLQGVLHEKLTAPALRDLAEAAEARPPGDAGAPEDAAAVLAALRWDRARALAVPERLVRELAEAQSASLAAWRAARAASEFGPFAPHLDRLLALRREAADALLPTLDRAPGAPPPERYDALLEGYEPGLRVARLEPLFARLRGWLVPLVERCAGAPPPPDPFEGRFDAAAQWELSLEVLELVGFDREAGRQDRSVHPFSLAADPGDVRLTTRVHEDRPLSSLFSTLHEAGHGLFEQGLPAAHRRDGLSVVVSMGLHESQSRLLENRVGRSLPFWRGFAPRMRARFPQLAGRSAEALHRGVNRVARTPIRTEADELTYDLHIALRFELELGLVRGELAVADLPSAWNAGMRRLLGIAPRDDAEGVLQDIHWAGGDLGYFPTYTVGNLYAASLFQAARRDLPALDDDLAALRLGPLRAWLRDRVHRHGRALATEELVRRATGHGLRDDDLRAALEAKFGALYPG